MRRMLQFATRSAGDKTIEMNSSTRDLRFFCCCLWLCLALYGQVLGQDVPPEDDDLSDFTTSTAATTTTTTAAEPATTTTTAAEPATTTTTTTTAEPATTTAASTTTTTAAAVPTTNPPPTYTTPSSYLPSRPPTLPPTMRPFYYPTYAPPSSPPVPAYTPSYHWLWDLDNSGEENCYLKNHLERSYWRWPCGTSGGITSCYRCCFYGHSRFAGCSKLHSGPCNPNSIGFQS